jgi:hypothetical protein
MKCQEKGKAGWKWGEGGKCYTGPDGKAQAEKQGRAIEASKHAAEQTKQVQELIK